MFILLILINRGTVIYEYIGFIIRLIFIKYRYVLLFCISRKSEPIRLGR